MKKLPIIIYGLFICALTSCPLLGKKDTKNKKTEKKKEQSFDEVIFNGMRLFAEVIYKVSEKHYKVPDPQKCIEKAMDAFLTCLDPHSGYLNQKKYKAILESTSGEFYGIGIIIDGTRKQQDKFLLIIETIPEGPADNAGLKALDKIVEIDGESLEGLTTEEAISKLKGEKNTTVHVKVLRENHPDIISVGRTPPPDRST